MGYVDLNDNKRTDWVTPPNCRELLAQMGPLKLDVCTVAENHMGAEQFYTPAVNGLKQSWDCGGLTWCNFPWSRTDSPQWVEKACSEGDRFRNRHPAHAADYLGPELSKTQLVLLSPARPDTAWFRRLWNSADVVYFWKGRMTFHNPDSGLPCMHFNKKSGRWEKQPVPVPVMLAYWGGWQQKFVDVFQQQGGVFAYPSQGEPWLR